MLDKKTLKQIVEQIQNDPNNGCGNTFEQVKAQVIDHFLKLYEENLIIYSERENDDDEHYFSSSNKNNNNKSTNNLLGNKEELKKNKNISNKKVGKKAQDKGKSEK